MFTYDSPSTGPGSPRVIGFHDEASGSWQYVAACPETGQTALIDVVQDFDPEAGRTRTDSAAEILDWVRAEGLTVALILDTHPHADHLMAQAWLKEQTGAPTVIGAKVAEIAALWRGYYNLPDAFDPARDFDRLVQEGETLHFGNLDVGVWLSPGHTLGSVSYLIGDAVFAHDTFMMPDSGTSRADFPGGTVEELYNSLQRILSLPDDYRVFIGHDYGAEGRDDPACMATVAEQKRDNIHLAGGTSEAEFAKLRTERDATLALPDRMLSALQINLRGGRLPPAEDDGHSYLKIPLNKF